MAEDGCIKDLVGENIDVTSNASIGGTLDVTSDLSVTGDTSVGGTFDVTGDLSVASDLNIQGKIKNDLVIGEDSSDLLVVNSNTIFTGTLTVNDGIVGSGELLPSSLDLTSPPSNPVSGTIRFNPDNKQLYVYYENSWNRIASGTQIIPQVISGTDENSLIVIKPSSSEIVLFNTTDENGFPITYTWDGHYNGTKYNTNNLPSSITSVVVLSTGRFTLTSSTTEGQFKFRMIASDGVLTASRMLNILVEAQLYAFSTFTFNIGPIGTAPADPQNGPTHAILLSGYSNDAWTANSAYFSGGSGKDLGVQRWTIPATGTYTFNARGGSGGDTFGRQGSGNTGYTTSHPGAGAICEYDIELTKSDIILLVVGQEGEGRFDTGIFHGGGGGGTFIIKEETVGSDVTYKLLSASGGGGASGSIDNYAKNNHAMAGTAGGNGYQNTSGGTDGGGGQQGANNIYGHGGAGWLENGSPTHNTLGGWSWEHSQRFKGGDTYGSYTDAGLGGFGGGGSGGHHSHGGFGGGGGGYSGGSVGKNSGNGGGESGGGGSYVIDTAKNVVITAVLNTAETPDMVPASEGVPGFYQGDGQVIVTLL